MKDQRIINVFMKRLWILTLFVALPMCLLAQQKTEYNRKGDEVNGDFLFLYDTNADWNDVVTAFPNYTYAGTGTTGTNGTNGVSEPSNPGTTKNANEQNSNVNTPNDAKNGMAD